MKISVRYACCSVALLMIFFSCNRGPKIISSPVETAPSQSSTGIFSDVGSVPTTASIETKVDDMHSVLVNEVLPTDKYIYLNVTENDETFWIATGKREVNKGETYIYKGGLLKTNFESKEYNRTFDKIFLVSNIVPDTHGHDHNVANPQKIETHSVEDSSLPRNIEKEGSIKISSLVSDPKKYEGKSIQISGECVKINPNIMGKNWIHLKDGSKDDYDLVITSDMIVPEGHVVTMSGIVSLDKDFGAGYRYDIIVEDGKIIN